MKRLKGKILILANAETTVYCFRRELLSRLVSQGYEVIVSYPKTKYEKIIEGLGCTFIDTKIQKRGRSIFADYKTYRSYKKLIREYNPDLVITYTLKPNIYGSLAAKKNNVKYMNNITGAGSVFQKKSLLRYILTRLQRKAYKRSSCVFFENYGNRQLFIDRRIVTDKTHTVNIPGTGVNLNMHAYSPMPEQVITKFVIVSRIRTDKGYDEFFEAVRFITAKYPNTEFHVVGRYDEQKKYEPAVRELLEKKLIIEHGEMRQEDLHEVIAGCHCLIHPSHHEGMANAVMEGAAAGRAVITSDIYGCREGVEDGVTGYLFKAGDSVSLIEKIEKFIALPKDGRAEMGKAGRKKMEREFDREKVTDIIMSEIEKVIR